MHQFVQIRRIEQLQSGTQLKQNKQRTQFSAYKNTTWIRLYFALTIFDWFFISVNIPFSMNIFPFFGHFSFFSSIFFLFSSFFFFFFSIFSFFFTFFPKKLIFFLDKNDVLFEKNQWLEKIKIFKKKSPIRPVNRRFLQRQLNFKVKLVILFKKRLNLHENYQLVARKLVIFVWFVW